jgi:hypothetical protein
MIDLGFGLAIIVLVVWLLMPAPAGDDDLAEPD